MESIIFNIQSIATLAFGIVLLIFFHELGHFMAARAMKVEVEEFGIGFPPRAATLFKHKGTVFTLNWLPLGGFVRPKGENDPTVEGGLAAASPWVRLGVLLAGPVTNLLIGVIIAVMLALSAGDPIPDKVLVGYVEPGSPAAEAGLREGDLFLEINGQTIDSITRLQTVIEQNLGVLTKITLLRGDETKKVELVPRENPPAGQGAIGVILDFPTKPISFSTAVDRGVGITYEYVHGILALPVRLVQGEAEPEDARLVGYKGMFDIFQRFQNPLFFFGIISISLGIMNLLPIPGLDGGRIMFVLPEILIRRRVPTQYENVINMIGIAILFLLFIYINIRDFTDPIQLP